MLSTSLFNGCEEGVAQVFMFEKNNVLRVRVSNRRKLLTFDEERVWVHKKGNSAGLCRQISIYKGLKIQFTKSHH